MTYIPKKLYKTTIVIWSQYDGAEIELSDLAYQAEQGDAYCSQQSSQLMTSEEIVVDPDWGDNTFFDWACEEEKEEECEPGKKN